MRDKKVRDKYVIGCHALSRYEERYDVIIMRAKKGPGIRKLFETPRQKSDQPDCMPCVYCLSVAATTCSDKESYNTLSQLEALRYAQQQTVVAGLIILRVQVVSVSSADWVDMGSC